MDNKKPKESEILSDHKRTGKRFVPPFVHLVGGLSEVSWVNLVIPQVIWIALLLETHGFKKGVDLSLSLSQTAKDCAGPSNKDWFGWTTSYSKLSEAQKVNLVGTLEASELIVDLSHAFKPFGSLFLDFPLSFITRKHLENASPKEPSIEQVKRILLNLYDKRSVFATRVQSSVIYLAFVNGFVKVAEGLTLASFPEVEKYPDTERSRLVAASVRATINLLAGTHEDPEFPEWSAYFWNTCLTIEPCERFHSDQEE